MCILLVFIQPAEENKCIMCLIIPVLSFPNDYAHKIRIVVNGTIVAAKNVFICYAHALKCSKISENEMSDSGIALIDCFSKTFKHFH